MRGRLFLHTIADAMNPHAAAMMATASSREIRCAGPTDPISQPLGRRLGRPLARSNHRLRRTSTAGNVRNQSEHEALAARCLDWTPLIARAAARVSDTIAVSRKLADAVGIAALPLRLLPWSGEFHTANRASNGKRGWHTDGTGCQLREKPASELLKHWCPRQDSNLRPSAPEADALSPELRGRMREMLRQRATTD